MNYKIRITAENQAIVKRIADDNGMKFNSFDSEKLGGIFLIVNNEITYYYSNSLRQKATLITTEQFIAMFDKKETKIDQWNNPTKESPKVETEWQPQRGDRVLVFDNNDDPIERIFLTEIKGSKEPIVVVNGSYEEEFKNNEVFYTSQYDSMKPLTAEQPKDTDFKTKVIELIEKRIDESVEKMKSSANDNSFQDALAWKIANQECGQLLKQIKQL